MDADGAILYVDMHVFLQRETAFVTASGLLLTKEPF